MELHRGIVQNPVKGKAHQELWRMEGGSMTMNLFVQAGIILLILCCVLQICRTVRECSYMSKTGVRQKDSIKKAGLSIYPKGHLVNSLTRAKLLTKVY